MKKLLTFSALLTVFSPIAQAEEDGFTSLFNGKDLTGWSKLGGKATFHVENGEIVGTTQFNTPNTFLTTNQHYSDFDLRFEVKLDNDELNSGCQIRSNSTSNYRNGSVHGYQCEIESRYGEAGFIYDESRRGWLSKDRSGDVKKAAYKKGQWNDYRILCQGDSIQTWVNGVAIANVTDSLTSNGFIGLQVHHVFNKEPLKVRWRNIRLKELPEEHNAVKELRAFTTTGNWSADSHGTIKLTPREGEGGWSRFDSYLWLNKQYADFSCSFEYRQEKGGNSGFYFRTQDTKNPVHSGIEVQLFDSHGSTSALTDHDAGGLIPGFPPSSNAANPAQTWNKMEVRCEGNHLKVWLNGVKVQDLYLQHTPLKSRPAKGFIGFQDHSKPLQIRKLSIREL